MFLVRVLFCLLIAPVMLFAQPGAGKDSILIKSGFDNELLLGEPFFLVDPGNTQSFSQISSDSFSLSAQRFLEQIKNHAGPNRYWIKFSLKNLSGSTLDLHLYPGYTDYADLYFISGTNAAVHLERGHLRPQDAGDGLADQTAGTLPLSLHPHQQGIVYLGLRQRSGEFYFKAIEVLDKNHLDALVMQDYDADTRFLFFQALFQGFLLCQLLYVFFQWLLIRRNEYLYYFFYLLLIALYFLSKYEPLFGINLLFTKFPIFRIYLSKTFLILPYYFYFRFVRSFLEMPTRYPELNRWIVPLEYFLLLYSIFDFLFIVISLNQEMQALISTFVLVAVFIISACFILYMFRRRKALVYYILSGSFFVGLGSIIGTILTFLENNEHIDMGVSDIMVFPQAGVILEICCFTAGLSYKSQASEKEKIQGQEKLIEQLKANELLQTRLQQIRNKIAQDLHDDIGSTLSSISILSDLAMKEKDSVQTIATMKEINTHSIQLMERMDDIVWSINPKNDTLENLMMRIRHFATTLFEARNIDYRIRIQPDINQVKIPLDYRQHIYLVLKEAINNLVKYSGATESGIHIWFDEQKLSMEVTDNGKGFDVSVQYPGNGIYGMQNRAGSMNAELEIRSGPETGTTLLLTVPFI
ncbi:MAG TPA: 7TM diverse intracellular signaling domain-containing protein [Puia sp.]